LAGVTEPVRLSLMTPLLVDTSRPGEVRLRESGDGARSYVLRYDAARFRASAEEIPIQDARLRPIWGDRLARVVLTSTSSAPRDRRGQVADLLHRRRGDRVELAHAAQERAVHVHRDAVVGRVGDRRDAAERQELRAKALHRLEGRGRAVGADLPAGEHRARGG